jgi:cytochrome c-type biogenesis protein CcmH/NrfG
MDGIVEQFLADHHFARQADILAVEHGEYAKSVKYFRRALNLNPDNVDVRISLGAVLMAINDFRSAEEELKKALRIQPANALALSNLGSVYGRTGRFREAQETYEKVLAVDPQYRDAYVRLGFTCLHLENDEEAEKMFREALRLDRHCVRALYYLGSLADKRSQPGEALKYYHAALQHVPDRQEPSLGVAQDLMHRKHLHDSIGRLLESIIEEDPRSVRAYLLLGQLRLQQADPEGAIKAFESAKKSGPVPPWVGPKIEELKFQRSRNGGTQGNPAPR